MFVSVPIDTHNRNNNLSETRAREYDHAILQDKICKVYILVYFIRIRLGKRIKNIKLFKISNLIA